MPQYTFNSIKVDDMYYEMSVLNIYNRRITVTKRFMLNTH